MIKHDKIFIVAFKILFLSIFPLFVSFTQAKTPPNIILISLDTLRADHLSTYGYHRNTSPFIDAFVKVKKWVDEHKSTPFFLFVHCYDMHAPYDPPPPYDSIFQDFTGRCRECRAL